MTEYHKEITLIRKEDDSELIAIIKDASWRNFNEFYWFNHVPMGDEKQSTGIVPLELYEPIAKVHEGKPVYELMSGYKVKKWE